MSYLAIMQSRRNANETPRRPVGVLVVGLPLPAVGDALRLPAGVLIVRAVTPLGPGPERPACPPEPAVMVLAA